MRSSSFHPRLTLDRYYFLAAGAVVYVALGALRTTPGGALGPGVLALLLLLLAIVWHRTRRDEVLTGRVHSSALIAARAAAWGASVWCAAGLGAGDMSALDAAANLGVGSSVVAGAVALARIPAGPDGSAYARSAPSLRVAVVSALAWSFAVALPALRALWPDAARWLASFSAELTTRIVSVWSALSLVAVAVLLRVTRRWELGVADRAGAAVALTVGPAALAGLAALAGVAPADGCLSFGVVAAGLGCTWVATAPDPTRVSHQVRMALSIVSLGLPVVLAATAAFARYPERFLPITLAACALAAVSGLLARRLATLLGGERSRWLRALGRAHTVALQPEPERALAATLEALGGLDENVATRPELWRFDPPSVVRVDVAGYLKEAAGRVPEAVLSLCRRQPERTLRLDVLQAIEVRRPEARPALAWMKVRELSMVTLLAQPDEELGLLTFPRGRRRRAITLQEVQAARRLADRLAAALSLSAALGRSQARERWAKGQSQLAEAALTELRAAVRQRDEGRSFLIEAFAARARAYRYGARSRHALDQLVRWGGAAVDVALVLPVGVDLFSHACVLHLSSDRRDGPLVALDASDSALQSADAWRGRRGPVARAHGGTLVLDNLAALPHAVQDALTITLASRKLDPATGWPPAVLVAALADSPRRLLEQGVLTRALATHLEPHVLPLPSLADRPDDLRAMILDRLCRASARYAKGPLGMEPEALAWLVRLPWPGNDAQLLGVVDCAAREAVGPRVTVADLQSSGVGELDDVGPAYAGVSNEWARGALSGVRPSPVRRAPPAAPARSRELQREPEPTPGSADPRGSMAIPATPRRRRRRR